MENVWYVAATWMALAFFASLISIRVGISVALIEIVVGVIAGNLPAVMRILLENSRSWAQSR